MELPPLDSRMGFTVTLFLFNPAALIGIMNRQEVCQFPGRFEKQVLATHLNTANPDDEEQLHHEEGGQEIHEGRSGQAPQVREETVTRKK